jgi:ABC-type glycerol-3-phosphate transport system substrate-binding protein
MQEWTPALQVKLLPLLADQLSTPIEIDVQGWDWRSFHLKLLRSLETNSAPDVIELGTTWTSRLIQEGVLLNVTRFASETLQAASTFFPRVLNSCRHNTQRGQYYALPLLTDLRILFYNDDILNGYLVNHPNAFKNWRAFEEMCLALRNVLPSRVIAWPLGREDALHDCLPWVWAAGGDFISQAHEILVDSEPTKRAFQQLARLILTGCAPLPPDYKVDNKDQLRILFATGQIGMMTGAVWMLQTFGQYDNIKTTLHPPDVYPTTFAGGSNLAVVQKGSQAEDDERYERALAFIERMTEVKNQIALAKAFGKLPCNILAWKEMKRAVHDVNTQAVFEAFDDALCHTVDRSMPNVPNLAQIEEELKGGVKTIWEKVGKLKRSSVATASLADLERSCAEMICQELTRLHGRVEKFLAGDTVQFTADEIAESGLQPPGRFDLWLTVTKDDPLDGSVYVAHQGKIPVGLRRQLFAILYALTQAPHRMLQEGQLLHDFWQQSTQVRERSPHQLEPLQAQLAQWTELLRKSIGASPADLIEVWNVLKDLGALPVALSSVRPQPEPLQRELCQRITDCCIELGQMTADSDSTHAVDSLRQAFRGLDKALGTIRGEPIILRPNKGSFDLTLNPNLSICIVMP